MGKNNVVLHLEDGSTELMLRLINEYNMRDVSELFVSALHTMNSFMQEKQSGFSHVYVKNPKTGKERRLMFPGSKDL